MSDQPTDAAVHTTDEGLRYLLDATGAPVGLPVTGWTPCEPVRPTVLEGRYCRLEAWDRARHADALFASLHTGTPQETAVRWTYIPVGPFEDAAGLADWLDAWGSTPGTRALVLVVTDGGEDRVEGTASYLRTDTANGTVEVGAIVYSAALQRARAATEAMYLMARHAVVDLGYRRYEWKCDALNAPSRSAALRLGFTFEGLWRQAVLYKGRNRDTAWFAFTDDDFAALAPAYERWLDAANFDDAGRQRTSLSALTRAALPR